ncbi:MAG: flagellar hook-associated protein FlgK [Ruminiclostridium sp.]
MAVGFSSYQIARSGLSVSERGLFVTGHNISNVDTTGYVRQQSIIESSPYKTEYSKDQVFQYGLGADIQETRQIRHTFLDNIYRKESTSLGYWETRSKAFQDVEAILNDPMGDGLQDVMNQFWDSWQELTKSPESLTTRALVRQRGQALVYHVNHIGAQLDKLQGDLNSEIQVRVDEVNSITNSIAQINKQIASQEINGDSANDYRDQRNVLLDRLSKICDAEPLEMQDGQIDVTLGGYYLVQKGTSRNLYVEANAKNGEFFYPMLENTDIEVNIKSGILKGLMESRGEVTGIKDIATPDGNIAVSKNIVSDFKIRLNGMVNKMVEAVNTLQRSGCTLDQTEEDFLLNGPNGVDFFDTIDDRYPMVMGNLRLSDALLSDKGLNNITASASPAKGDNSIAREIANLRDADILKNSTGDATIDEFYRAIILDVGNGGSEATTISENQSKLVQSAEGQRDAISGVSMDEEMANMMKFKFAYDGSAKVLNVIDSMMETIIMSMGRVGR